MTQETSNVRVRYGEPTLLRAFAFYFRKAPEAREQGIRESYLHSCAKEMEDAADELERMRRERAAIEKAFREAGYVGDDLVAGVASLRGLFDAARAGHEPPAAPIDRQRLRSKIGCFMLENGMTSDNLAIALCTYFEGHMDRPKPDPETEHGWGQWASENTDRVLDELTDEVLKLIPRLTPPPSDVPDMRSTLLRVVEAVQALSRIEDGKTLFEASPSKSQAAFDAWLMLNESVAKANYVLDKTKEVAP